MTADTLRRRIAAISAIMDANKDDLIKLDQQNGDGDLGVSMSEGYRAVVDYLNQTDETNLGKLLMKSAFVFNESAPSSLGTISSFAFMGMAEALKGKQEATFEEFADAFMAGVEKIMEKASSKPGEKTILDALYPGAEALIANKENPQKALKLAYEAAAAGSEKTKEMRSVHGRAAYYGDKSIGILDGGSVVGKLIFEGLNK